MDTPMYVLTGATIGGYIFPPHRAAVVDLSAGKYCSRKTDGFDPRLQHVEQSELAVRLPAPQVGDHEVAGW